MSHSSDINHWFSKKLIKSRPKDINPLECSAIHRLRIIIEHYYQFIETSQTKNGINHILNRGYGIYSYISRTLKNYSTVKLLDDYHYILNKYKNQFSSVYEILITNIGSENINIETSVIFKRNNRNRQYCSYKNDIRCEYYGGYNASEEVSVQKLMDKIYCHLILSFDAGYQLSQNEILQIATQQIQESKEIYYQQQQLLINGNNTLHQPPMKEKDDAVDSPLKMIVNITKKKNQILYKVRGEERMKYNKFVTHLNDDKLDNKQDDDDEEEEKYLNNENNIKPDTYEIDFGYQFKYWKSYRDSKWYIPKKYDNLKSEMSRNKICKISDKQFEDDIKNAIAYKNCKRGRKLKCKYLRLNYNEPTENEIKIKTNTPISIDHMLALMIFCNYDILRRHIVSVFKKLKLSESDESLKLRHSEYAHICRLLYESIRLFGTNIAKHQGFSMTFYHCFNKQIYFDEFHCYFSYPTSTTTSLSVINTYCPSSDNNGQNNGLIVQLKKDIEYQGDQHFMDTAWFSDYGNESEKLFLNIMLGFKSILYPSLYHNYGQYLNAFTALQSMVIGSELNNNILTPLIPKFLKQIIENKLDKVPKYILSLFQSFREQIENIQINVWLMIIDSYELMDEVFSDDEERNNNYHERIPNDGNQYGYLRLHSLFIQSDGWIYIDRLALLFPQVTHIQLFNGNIQTGQILPCITLDESTMNNLLNILVSLSKKTLLNKISFYYPDENLLSINMILKHFTQWFHQIKWNIKTQMEKAPFLPEKCKPVPTLIILKQ